jgi:ABC-type uncharacterized transport system auxiliary subunit
MRLTNTVRLLGTAAVILSLGGCLGSAPPVPRDHYYRVSVRPASYSAAQFKGTISVAPVEADGLLRERPLLFTQQGGREIQQHDYHYWTEAPPHMLQALLVDFLRSSGAAESVVTPDLRLPADFEITGRIRRMERQLTPDAARVVAELELAMTQVQSRRLIVIKSYSAEVVARDTAVEASVLALDEALSDIFSRFLADAGTNYLTQSAAAPK